MPSVIVRTMVACGVEQNDILEPKKIGMTLPKNRTKKNA